MCLTPFKYIYTCNTNQMKGKIMETQKNYLVVGRIMDGVTAYTVVHQDDKNEFLSKCYRSSIMNGLSLSKKEMQKLADEMNDRQEGK